MLNFFQLVPSRELTAEERGRVEIVMVQTVGYAKANTQRPFGDGQRTIDLAPFAAVERRDEADAVASALAGKVAGCSFRAVARRDAEADGFVRHRVR